MRVIGISLAIVSMMFAVGVAVAAADEPVALEREEIIDLVSERTIECRKEKDQSLCANWFSEDGVIKRIMLADGARKEGVWFVDDQDRLCILWTGKIKPLCFVLYEQEDGSYHLIKRGKHITTIIGTEAGNTKDL
jgi:hypothetical protein